MTKQEIVLLALENIQLNTQILGKWKEPVQNQLDGYVVLNIDNQKITFNIEIKKELRQHQLNQIIELNRKFAPFMIVVGNIFPKIKVELRKNNIAWMEASGNIYLNNGNNLIWIDNQKPIQPEKVKESRAFTKTGLKVLFRFLTDETWINKPYRAIAEQTQTGIGNITNIMNGLKQENFLLPLGKNEYTIKNKEALLDKWMAAYEQKLKPELKIGTFRFQRDEDFRNWKNINMKTGETFWGGEPAGDLLTNYLQPAELTIYTTEIRNDLIKNYRLIPDKNGNLNVYKKFWHQEQTNKKTVPPLLVYVDLMNKQDGRCRETAELIRTNWMKDEL